MKAAGFHWFVAWRYLMARPRRVSPTTLAVTGLLLIASIAASFIGDIVLRRGQSDLLMPHGAYENALIGAVAVLAMGAAVMLFGLVHYCRTQPGRIWVPFATSVGLLVGAIGAVAHGADDEGTRAVARSLLIVGGSLLAAAVLRYGQHMRGRAGAPLAMAGLLVAAGGAALAIAHDALAPVSTMAAYPADVLLLPALALWGAGMVVAVVVLMHYRMQRRMQARTQIGWRRSERLLWWMLRGRLIRGLLGWMEEGDWQPRRPAVEPRLSRVAAGVSLFLLLAAAIYPRLAHALAPRWHEGIELMQYLPTGGSHASLVLWIGLGLAGMGILLRGIAALRRPGDLAAVELGGVALLTAGGLCVLIARFVFAVPDQLADLYLESGVDHQVLLVAVVLLALGELTLVLGMVRYFFTFFTTVSVAGVAIGSMALVIVLSVMSGFESDLRDKILGSNAHVLITKEEGSFSEYREVAARIEDLPGVVAHTPYLVSEVVIAANNNYANVIIKGVDPETIGDVTELDENLEQPRALERLYPLADDGSIRGPSSVAGDAGAASPGPGADIEPDIDGVEADPGAAGTWDPPPPDMDVDIDAPQDFSGRGQPEPTAPDGAVAQAAGPGGPGGEDRDDRGGGEGGWDPPPSDMDVDIDAPQDFSGTAPAVAGVPRDAIAPFDATRTLDDASLEPRIPPRVARLPGVLAGKELVKQIHLYVGQEVRIVSPLGEDTPAGPVPRTRFMRVAGTFFTGMYEYDLKFVYVPLNALQSFLDLGDEVSGIEVRVDDPERTGPVLEAIRAALPEGYRVQDWKEINRSLFSALKLEKIAMFLVLAIIILVASFSIVGNLVMVVVEKAKEIALIKTLGATDGGVVKIFVAQGFFIGLVGTVIGVAHGLVACILGSIYGLPLDPEVYYIDQLPIHIEPMAVAAIAVAGVLISVVATLYPASVGARLRPLEGLRYD